MLARRYAWAVGLCVAACDSEVALELLKTSPGRITVIESGGPEGDTGWWPSLAFDHDDTPHLSFCDAYHGDLRYATIVDGAWRAQSVVSRGAVGKYTALAVNSRGSVGIAFYDQDRKYLRYAWRDPTPDLLPPQSKDRTQQTDGENGWRTERIAWGLEIGMAGALRFDADDVPHLFYYIPSGRLIHAYKKEKKWHKQTVAVATGSFSVTIDAVLQGRGYWLTYIDWTFRDTLLHLARPNENGGFTIEMLTDRLGPGWRSQLAFEGNRPIVFYSTSRKPQLRVSTPAEGGWESKRLVPHAANFRSLRRKDGSFVVAYEDIERGAAGKGIMRYLIYRDGPDGGTAAIHAVDPDGPAGAYLSLALNSKDEMMIAYYAGDIRGLKVYDEVTH